jgi:N6-adenosine-specific RNA methylase IME4
MNQKNKYNIICIDPPYIFSDKLKQSTIKRSADSQYPTLTIAELKKLPIKDIVADDAIMALWVPSALLQDGLDLLKIYGFNFKQTLIWVKVQKHPFKQILSKIRQNWKNRDKKRHLLPSY